MSRRSSTVLRPMALLLLCILSPAGAWYGSEVEFWHLTWSPDSRHLAFGATYYDDGSDEGGTDDVVLCVAVDSPATPRLLTPGLRAAALAHDGRGFAFVNPYGLFALDLADGRRRQLLLVANPGDRRNRLVNVVWSGSDRAVAFTHYDYARDGNTVAVLGLDTAAAHLTLLLDDDWAPGLTALYWEADSTVVCAKTRGETPDQQHPFWRLNARTGEFHPMTLDELRAGFRPRPSARGDRMDIVIESLGIELRRFRSGITRDGWLDNVLISPDRRWVAYEQSWEGGRETRIVRADGKDDRTVRVGSPWSWLPDGSSLLSCMDGSWQVSPVEGSPRQLFPVAGKGVGSPAFASDGRRFVFVIQQDDAPRVALASVDSAGYRVLCPGQSPRWLSDSLILAVTADGLAAVTLPRHAVTDIPCLGNGHHPSWLDDSTVVFSRGMGEWERDGESGRSVVYPGSRRHWQVDVNSGRMRPTDVAPTPQAVMADAKGEPLLSPDGRLVAWIEDIPSGEGDHVRWYRTGIFVADKARTWRRLLVGPWANF